MSLTFQLGISSIDAIQLMPEYDFSNSVKLIESRHRTQAGTQYSYKWGDYARFEFSLEYVTEANATIINSWWQSRSELLFFVDSGGTTDIYSVMVMNDDRPLDGYNKPYDSYRNGKLILETY